MANYPYRVLSAWYVVEQLARDWQADPYRWDREIDFQAELFSRLSQVYRLVGVGTVKAIYKKETDPLEREPQYSRVACEPWIDYRSKGRKYRAYPDIVVWDDIPDPTKPPPIWPVLWACEIKYGSSSKDGAGPDLEKLGYLIRQRRIQYGCWLRLFFKRAREGDGLFWNKHAIGQKLWICDAYFPPLDAEGQKRLVTRSEGDPPRKRAISRIPENLH